MSVSISMRRASAAWVVGALLFCQPVPSSAWIGKVIGAADGDMITVLHNRQPEKIRLGGIDCPEKSQDFGTKAKCITSIFVFAKVVEVAPVTMDRSERTVAFVGVGNTVVNEKLIRQGLARVFIRYSDRPICERREHLETGNREPRRGLWSMPDSVPPRELRNRMRAPDTLPGRGP